MAPNLSRVVWPSQPVDAIAVAVRRTDGTGGHAGIAYRSHDGTTRLLHFACHHELRDDPFVAQRARYLCVVPNLRRDDAVALAAYCRLIYQNHEAGTRIPYNLEYEPDTGFDPDTGELILPEHGTGMTCATFVVHVFRSSGNPIIDVDGWVANRPGDKERQEELVHYLENHADRSYQAQGARIRSQIGCPRVRPEDVGGGCLEDALPAGFECCDLNGRIIVGLLTLMEQQVQHIVDLEDQVATLQRKINT